MESRAFKAFCPLELGDTVIVRRGGDGGRSRIVEETRFIADILAVHSAASGAVRFAYRLDDGRFVRLHDIEARVVDGRRVEVGRENPRGWEPHA